MRKWLAAGLVTILVLSSALLGCKVGGAPPGASPPEAAGVGSMVFPYPATGIQVVGQGEVRVKPDVALINLGVEAQAKTAAEARSQAAQAMGQVLEALRSSGVAEKDIRTYHFTIQPVREYDRETKREILFGFRVTNLITAKVREMDKIGGILDTAVEAGGNLIRVQGISFRVENPKPFYAQARKEALAEAMTKAQELAQLAGVKLGKPTYINESTGYYYPRPITYFEAGGMPIPAPTPTPISPGEQRISLTVQVTFAIE